MDIFFCSFGLNQKNQKFKPKTKAPLFWQANAQGQSSKIANTFCFRADSLKAAASCLFVTHGGAVFFVCFS